MALRPEEMHAPQQEAEATELDETDWSDLLSEAHYILTRALDIKQPRWLTQEASALLKRIDEALSWHNMQ